MDFKESKIEKGRREQTIREGSQTPQDCAASRFQASVTRTCFRVCLVVTFPLSTPRVSERAATQRVTLGFQDEFFLQNGPYMAASGFTQGYPKESVISSDLRRGKGVGKRKDITWDAVGITDRCYECYHAVGR